MIVCRRLSRTGEGQRCLRLVLQDSLRRGGLEPAARRGPGPCCSLSMSPGQSSQQRGLFAALDERLLSGSTAALSQEVRDRCERAVRGESLAVEDWLTMADAVLTKSHSLTSSDVVLVLRACDAHGVDDPSLFASLAERCVVAVPQMSLGQSLAALELFGRVYARGGRRQAPAQLLRALVERIAEQCGRDAYSLLQTSSVLARSCGEDLRPSLDGAPGALAALRSGGARDSHGPPLLPLLLRGLAVGLSTIRQLDHLEVLALEKDFLSLGLLQGPVKELLTQRKSLFLECGTPAELLAILQRVEAEHLPEWQTLPTEEEEDQILGALLVRLETLADERAKTPEGGGDRRQRVDLGLGEDVFGCLLFLQRRQRVPTSLLRFLCTWARQTAGRRGGGLQEAAAPLTARQLVVLDDACDARNLVDDSREDLDAAIRTFIVKGHSSPGDEPFAPRKWGSQSFQHID
eukprot:TRINITY_DN43596_c0_g1_i1.p1 TRINITY_DN43596_c0_g1~~TRINITY_DN43596_c0_g1_i1.p1  ORF type:complete len:462 (-),score=75.32 TRINITY_DN43596_c0_g1_i1:59-1444(-)